MTITSIERFLHFASRIRLDHKLSKIEITENRAGNDMSEVLPIVYLARHGETAWTISGQHTSVTDLTLTERGERNAHRLKKRLRGASLTKVFTSALQRARRTCELAGFGSVAQIDPDLIEWNYGEYRGSYDCSHPQGAPRLATVSRRLPGRGITERGRRAGGPRDPTSARGRR